jgi:hypothetical protein
MKLHHAIAMSVAISCAGCVPFDRTELPEIHGKVVNRHTSAPIANAAVTITGGVHGNLVAHATTDAAGRFEFAKVSDRVWLPPLNWDIVVPDARIDVSASGFESWSINLNSVRPVDIGPGPAPPAEIRLSLRRADTDP